MLSIIIPIYNEVRLIEKILDKVFKLKSLKKQIILVDDGSTDGTVEVIKKKLLKKVSKVIFHKKNMGKGFAIRSAKNFVKGRFVIIQDADLEYDPKDYCNLLKPIIDGKTKVVYGSRVLNKNRYLQTNFSSGLRVFFNHILTIFSNILYNQKLTDAHTCYKVFDAKIFKLLNLKENDFAFCPEVTAKLTKMGVQIFELPIKYKGRNIKEGKKIRLFDGFRALYVLLKYKFLS